MYKEWTYEKCIFFWENAFQKSIGRMAKMEKYIPKVGILHTKNGLGGTNEGNYNLHYTYIYVI